MPASPLNHEINLKTTSCQRKGQGRTAYALLDLYHVNIENEMNGVLCTYRLNWARRFNHHHCILGRSCRSPLCVSTSWYDIVQVLSSGTYFYRTCIFFTSISLNAPVISAPYPLFITDAELLRSETLTFLCSIIMLIIRCYRRWLLRSHLLTLWCQMRWPFWGDECWRFEVTYADLMMLHTLTFWDHRYWSFEVTYADLSVSQTLTFCTNISRLTYGSLQSEHFRWSWNKG